MGTWPAVTSAFRQSRCIHRRSSVYVPSCSQSLCARIVLALRHVLQFTRTAVLSKANMSNFSCAVTSLAVGVLIASHDTRIDQWHIAGAQVQPQVWVSACSTIANALLGYLFAEGLTIRFWRQAMRGTTVGNLIFKQLPWACRTKSNACPSCAPYMIPTKPFQSCKLFCSSCADDITSLRLVRPPFLCCSVAYYSICLI